MADFTQNGAPVFVTPTPNFNGGANLFYTSPDSAYPPSYAIAQQQQQQQQTNAVRMNSVLLGRKRVIRLGVLLVVSSLKSQAGAAVGFRYYAGLSQVGVGIWCGYMFMAAGIVAIVAGYHGTRKLIIATTVTSALAVVAAVTQLSVAAAGLAADLDFYSCHLFCSQPSRYYCSCYEDKWVYWAIAANSMLMFAALSALIGGIRLLVASCNAVHRNRTSFEVHSVPVQQQQQPISLNHAPPNTYELAEFVQHQENPKIVVSDEEHLVRFYSNSRSQYTPRLVSRCLSPHRHP